MKRKCCHCGQPGGKGPRELRPYGPGGLDVCAECVLSKDAPPDRKATAEAAMDRLLLGNGPLILDTREQAGPRPMLKKGPRS